LKKIKIGTGSDSLALRYGKYVCSRWEATGVEAEVLALGEDSSFCKKIEDALLRGDVDMAVCALKNLPTTQPAGLVIAGVSHREDPADWLLLRREAVDEEQLFRLKTGAVVGISGPLRKVQALDFRKDLEIRNAPGSVSSRLEELRSGAFDAIMLSAAAVSWLKPNLADWQLLPFSPREFIPTPGQGVLAYLCCEDDKATRRLIQRIHHPEVSSVTNVERKILKLLGGERYLPLGAFCERDAMGNYHLRAAMADAPDASVRRVRLSSSTNFNLAEKAAESMSG
jgi:hydroxymethylbilane synthase